MSNALRTSVSDLSRSLQKALMSSNIDQNIALKAEEAGSVIAQTNRSEYPEIKAAVAKLDQWSWAISFTAPSLWSGTFGSREKQGNQFITSANLSEFTEDGGLRGEV